MNDERPETFAALPRSSFIIHHFPGFPVSTGCRAAQDFVGAADQRGVWGLVQQFGRLAGNAEEGLGEGVQRRLALRLGRLNHHRLVDDEREIDRRGMEAVVQQPLGEVHGA